MGGTSRQTADESGQTDDNAPCEMSGVDLTINNKPRQIPSSYHDSVALPTEEMTSECVHDMLVRVLSTEQPQQRCTVWQPAAMVRVVFRTVVLAHHNNRLAYY